MVWTADFKGQFRLRRGSGAHCYPLTVLDLHTHYLLGCRALEGTSVAPTRQAFTRLFRAPTAGTSLHLFPSSLPSSSPSARLPGQLLGTAGRPDRQHQVEKPAAFSLG